MRFTLRRHFYDADGVFGTLENETGNPIATTLEHSYDSGLGNGSFVAKVALGTYTCLRHPPNRLPYETFELQNVPEFDGNPVSGILIHIGNFDKDSEGCILLGSPDSGSLSAIHNILNSKRTFDEFMESLKGQDSFTLEIK